MCRGMLGPIRVSLYDPSWKTKIIENGSWSVGLERNEKNQAHRTVVAVEIQSKGYHPIRAPPASCFLPPRASRQGPSHVGSRNRMTRTIEISDSDLHTAFHARRHETPHALHRP